MRNCREIPHQTEKRTRMSARIGIVFIGAVFVAIAGTAAAQRSPGPLEILPFEDANIVEAWADLLAGTQIADWTGWTASSWESPNAYNGHEGTDFALDTGTPVYAAAPGTVAAVTTNVPENTGSSYGNYVRIALDGQSPLGENLDVVTAHMLPSIVVTVGQRVTTGQLIGYSDNTGNSTSEHVHVESSIRGSTTRCPFYHALFKYPIMFNPAATRQVGHVVRVKAASTPIRSNRLDSAAAITTAYRGQMFYSPYWQRGYYRIFIPNNAQNRSGWLKATDVAEVFEGTVIQALPDAGTYVHTQTLAAPLPIRSAPDDAAAQMAQIVFGGGRFVADQQSGAWYRIAVPGSATWGWVKPNDQVVVYPALYNPAVNPAARPYQNFPIAEGFAAAGRSSFGRPKFNRSFVKAFSPASPGGDGYALFITDSINFGDGVCESILVGRPEHRNYFVQADVYFAYKPTQGGYERYGIFARDDGFAGMDQTFEGKGNCYAITFDTDDGRLRAAKIMDATVTDFLPAKRYVTSSGWHTLRIEMRENRLRFIYDQELLIETTDTTFPSGPCGMGYSNRTTSSPSDRGAYFDNFVADSLDSHGPATLLY